MCQCGKVSVLHKVILIFYVSVINSFMDHTLKVAGTEEGIKEPQATFSACFGAAFIMLHPTKYAAMLAEKMQNHGATGWLVNTGWSGGRYAFLVLNVIIKMLTFFLSYRIWS